MENSSSWPDLESGEEEITQQDAGLFRQVNPKYIEGEDISWLAFRPTDNDNGKVSVRSETKIDAKNAYEDHQTRFNRESKGTYKVAVGEVNQIGLRAVDDSVLPGRPPGHSYIDFRILEKEEFRAAAERLSEYAEARGAIYTP